MTTDDVLFTIDECLPNESAQSLRSALKRVNASLEAYQGIRTVSSFHVVVKICFGKQRQGHVLGNEEEPLDRTEAKRRRRKGLQWHGEEGTVQQR